MKLALIVVDLQKRFEEMSRKMNIVEKVARVMTECRRNNVPIFLTQHHDPDPDSVLRKWWSDPIHKGSDCWQLVSEIKAASDETKDSFVSKSAYDAFEGTDLKEQLLKLGVDTVVVCGAMTNLCCESTARSAFNKNFNLIFLRDGNATSTVEYHDATLKNLEFGFATMKTCDEFIASLKHQD